MCPMLNGPHSEFQRMPDFPKNSQKTSLKLPQPKATEHHTRPRTKTYAEATNRQNSSTEHIYGIFSQFISNLNTLISPLITLLFSVPNAFIAKNII